MELNKNSFTAKLVEYSYPNKDLGNNLCTYFWQTFFAYLFLPLICIFYIFDSYFFRFDFKKVLINKESKPFLVKICFSSLLIILLIGFICFSYLIGFGSINSNYIIINIFVGLGFMILICSIIILFTYSLYKIIFFFKKKKRKEKKKNIIIEYIKAKKQKICPIIEWK